MSLTHKPYRFNSHFEKIFFKKKTEKKCITYLNYLVMIFVSSTIDGSIIYVLFVLCGQYCHKPYSCLVSVLDKIRWHFAT
jgi:hypothetical protein